VTFRAKWMDPDFRRDPKTLHYCIMCGRDLKPGQPHRKVMYELDRFEAVHSEDWEIAEPEIRASRNCNSDPVVYDLLGMDCARKLGLEWSRQP
jgi:hypothetical protein